MAVISDEQAKQLASGITAIGGVSYYGAGGGGYSGHAADSPGLTKLPKNTPSQNLWGKIASVGKQAAGITEKVAKTAGGFVANSAVDIGKQAFSTGKTFVDATVQPQQIAAGRAASDALSQAQDKITEAYRTGNMSKQNYIESLRSIAEKQQEVGDKYFKPIIQGPTPGERAGDLANTAANILTLGRASTLTALTKAGVREAITTPTAFSKAGAQLEDIATKIPAVRNLVERNAAGLAKQLPGETSSQFIKRESKQIAVGLLLKRPIFYQQNIEQSKDVYEAILSGNYGSAASTAALQATQMLEGGPIGAFLKSGKWIKGKLGELSYGNGSVIDDLSKEIGTKDSKQIALYISGLDKNSDEFKQSEKIFRIMQETNLRVTDNQVGQAVKNILSNYDHAGVPRELITPQTLVKDYQNWYDAAQIVNGLSGKKIKGISSEELQNLVVVRWDSVMKRGLAGAILKAGNDRNAMAAALSDFAEKTTNGWTNNPTLMRQLTRIVDEATSAEQAAARIKSIPTALAIPDNIPRGVAKKLADLGYGVAVPEGGFRVTPIVDYSDTRKLISAATDSSSTNDVFDPATAPMPFFGTIATGLEKAGLSPRSASQVASKQLAESVVANLEEVGIARDLGFSANGDVVRGGQVILSKLQKYVTDQEVSDFARVVSFGKARPALTDIRQMTTKEVKTALSVSSSDAKAIQKAVMKGYVETPLSYRGLGDKIVDYAYRVNPLQKYYSRIQSALRYSYNPFFAAQEAVETSVFAGLSGGNRATNLVSHNLMWNKSRAELNGVVDKLDNSGIFSSSLAGEAAQDQVLGRLTADITRAQKRDLAGLALDMAKSQGTDIDTLMRTNPEQIADALRIIVQYPQKGSLASPLARTLNVAFFPMRYNLKVTAMAANILAKQPPAIQLAVTHSLLNFTSWLKSDEGIQWQSANADALQIFNWITPINSIESTLHLLGGKPDAIGEMGQLGGLPFGLISQMLDSQGIINLNTPYVNPKTGDVFPKYIPDTTKARAATAIQDVLGSLFTYPGRILGLPGKQQTLNGVVRSFVDTNGSDFIKEDQMGRLTPLEKNWVRVLQGDTSKEAVDALYNAPTPDGFNWYTLPPLNVPQAFTVPNKIQSKSRTEIAAAKKAGKSSSTKVKPTAKPIGQL